MDSKELVVPAEATTERNVEDLSRQVLKEIIELHHYNLNYSSAMFEYPRFRRIRYFIAQEADAASVLAFEIVALRQLGPNLRTPSRISTSALQKALNGEIVGQSAGAAASLFELGANLKIASKHKREGFDQQTALENVERSLKHIDELLKARDDAVKALPNEQLLALRVAQGAVLEQTRKYCQREFIHLRHRYIRRATTENTFYVLNTIVNAVGLADDILAKVAIQKSKYLGPTFILFAVSTSLGGISPYLSSVAAKVRLRHVQAKYPVEFMRDNNFEYRNLMDSRTHLEQEISMLKQEQQPPASITLTQELSKFDQDGEFFNLQMDKHTPKIEGLRRTAVEADKAAPISGAGLTAQGIVGIAASYGLRKSSKRRNSFVYASLFPGAFGSGFSVLDSAVALCAHGMFHHRANKRGLLFHQIMSARLAKLEEIEKQAADF
jgi:hypothetical protein